MSTVSQDKLSEDYAIYSKLISGTDEVYLIDESVTTSRGGRGGAPPLCLRADPATTSEITADLDQRKDVVTKLERRFALDKPYQLLDASTVSGFLNFKNSL